MVEELDLATAGKTTEVPSRDPLIGMTFGGRYTVTSLLDTGGMGRIYLARQDRAPMEVVVKVVAPHRLSDGEAVARFEREARRLEALQHPNIVEMLDYGAEGGRSYLVMEYIVGESLGKYLHRKGRLRLKRFVPIAAQVLKGIGFVHARGVVVRDIKPGNIMLCERGGKANVVKILDFGLAKRIDGDYQITTEVALGTFGFMAPETLAGATPDLKVDIYALGVLFYFMLSGRMPLRSDSDSTETSPETLLERAPPLRDALPPGHDIPTDLIALVDLCRSNNPAERPVDANELLEMLIDAVPAPMFRLPSVWGEHADDGAPPDYDSDTIIDSPARDDPPRVTVQVYNRDRRRSLATGLLIGGGVAVGLVGLVLAGSRLGGQQASGPTTLAGEIARDGVGPGIAKPSAESPGSDVAEAPEAPSNAAPPRTPPQPSTEREANPDEDRGRGADTAGGKLVLTSVPTGATVYIDGEETGTTPYDDGIAAGIHAIEVRAPDHKPWSIRMEIDATTKPIAIELVREPTNTPPRSRRRKPGREEPSPPPKTSKSASAPSSEPNERPPTGEPAAVKATGVLAPGGLKGKEGSSPPSFLRTGSSKGKEEPILLEGSGAP